MTSAGRVYLNFKSYPIAALGQLRVAIVHDWLVVNGGAERVLEQMLGVVPQADLFAVVDFLDANQRGIIKNKPVTTTFVQKLPGAKHHYRKYLPLMPMAIEQLDMSGYNLVISSSASVAKGVITGPDQLHICMCYSPMRYAWDLTHQYLNESGQTRGIRSWLTRWLLHRIRMWDYRTANGVDEFIAISHYISRRIKKVYGRESPVIYPPVDVNFFSLAARKEDYYVTASRMVPYKRIDLIVETFSQMPERRLVVIGDGPEFNRIKKLATPNIELPGYQPHEVLKSHLQNARAFVFAAEEDFGIAPLEASACGTPVIAFGRGGARETVVEGRTGIFFEAQTVESLREAIRRFERRQHQFDSGEIRRHAEEFSVARFEDQFARFVTDALARHHSRLYPKRRLVGSDRRETAL